MYYLFSPLLDDKGERVVRQAQQEEWYDEGGPYQHWLDNDTVREHPILTMQKFEDDPLKEIKTAYELYKNRDPNLWITVSEEVLWHAIKDTTERVK
jgi:hypothetical protein